MDEQDNVQETPDPATPQAYKQLVFATKAEADDHYNEVFSERDQRMRKTIREEVTGEILERLGMDDVDEVAAVFEEAQSLQSADQTDAEKEKKRADKLAEKVKRLEGERDELQGNQSRAANLEKMLRVSMKDKLEQVPELARPFVEDLPVEKQAKWFEENADKLTAAPANQTDEAEPQTPFPSNRPAGQPPTGRPADGGPDKEKQKEAEQEQRSLGISRI